MAPASKWMLAYGLFLIAGALVAISVSGWDRSKTALFSSGGAAFLMANAALMASARPRSVAALGRVAGVLLPLLFAGTFAWRLSLNRAKPTAEAWLAQNPGQDIVTAEVQSSLQNWLFPAFILGSLVAALLVARSPKRAE